MSGFKLWHTSQNIQPLPETMSTMTLVHALPSGGETVSNNQGKDCTYDMYKKHCIASKVFTEFNTKPSDTQVSRSGYSKHWYETCNRIFGNFQDSFIAPTPSFA